LKPIPLSQKVIIGGHGVLVPVTDFQIRGIANFGEKAMIGENQRLVLKTGDQGMKMGIIHIGSGTIPTDHQGEVVENETELSQHTWFDQKLVGPILMSFKEPKQTCPFRKFGEKAQIIPSNGQPTRP
jgi:hypothetical protein